MKIFQNPVVVGVLAILALAVVVHALWPALKPAVTSSRGGSATVVPALALVAPQPPSATQQVPAPAIKAAARVNLESVLLQTNLPRWADSPRRDPFLMANTGSISTTSAPPWKVNGIWRQNGITLVAINQHICRAGDVLEGYTITAINDNEVSLEKDGQKTSVGFGFGHPTPTVASGAK